MNPIGKLDTVLWDVRYAFRQILRSPGFTAVAVGLLALGIGANVALFTVIQAIEFRPAPGVGNTKGAVRIVPILINRRGRYPANGGRGSYEEYLAYREQRETFVDVAAWAEGNATMNSGAGSSSARLIFASSGYFTTLRLKMALGSGFSPQDDTRGDVSPVAVASHQFWKRDLDGAPNVMGRQVTIGTTRVTIIGVAPARFNGVDYTDNAVDLWLPLGLYPVIFPNESEMLTDPNGSEISYMARLRPGVTEEKATAVVATVASRVGSARRPSSGGEMSFEGAARPQSGARPQAGGGERYTAETAPLLGSRPTGVSELGEIFAVFSTVGLFILLITCTNVSNMLVGRAVGRRKEMGVRLALGAARGRIIRQLLTESSVLAVLATILAMILIHIILRVVFYFAGAVLPDLTPTIGTILFASSVAIGTGVVFGLAPALHASNAPLSEVLKSGGGGGIDRRRSRLQAGFVVAQLSLTIPALAVAGMAVGFVVASAAAKTGIDESEKVLTVPLQLQSNRFGGREADALATQAKHRVRAIPGVTHVALASGLPAAGPDRPGWTVGGAGQVRGGGFVRLDNPSVLTSSQVRPSYLRVDPDFFAITGIPIRRGRAIQPTDIKGAPFVVVVSEDFAQTVWPNENPLGKSLVRGNRIDTTFTVVGVAGIIRRMGTPAPTVYGAREQRGDSALDGRTSIREGDVFVPTYSTTMYVRMDRAADPMVAAVQAAVTEVSAGIRILNPRTLAARRENQLNEMLYLMYAAFAAAAVLMTLSSVGIYAIVAHGVTQRTREIGVRIALGARSHQVIGLFIRQGVVLTLIGLSIGLPLAVGGIKLSPLNGEFPQQGHSDIYGIAGMVVVLIIVAAFASWLPARRAARVDPLVALRSE